MADEHNTPIKTGLKRDLPHSPKRYITLYKTIGKSS